MNINNPYYYHYPNYYQNNPRFYNHNYNKDTNSTNIIHEKQQEIKTITNSNENTKNKKQNNFIEILGIKLYFDDILLILLIYFLYTERNKRFLSFYNTYLIIIVIIL